jgi:hypothetical protein
MQHDETARKSIQRESKEFFHSSDRCGEVAELSGELLIQRSFFAQQTGYSPQASWDGDPLTRKAGIATGA